MNSWNFNRGPTMGNRGRNFQREPNSGGPVGWRRSPVTQDFEPRFQGSVLASDRPLDGYFSRKHQRNALPEGRFSDHPFASSMAAAATSTNNHGGGGSFGPPRMRQLSGGSRDRQPWEGGFASETFAMNSMSTMNPFAGNLIAAKLAAAANLPLNLMDIRANPPVSDAADRHRWLNFMDGHGDLSTANVAGGGGGQRRKNVGSMSGGGGGRRSVGTAKYRTKDMSLASNDLRLSIGSQSSQRRKRIPIARRLANDTRGQKNNSGGQKNNSGGQKNNSGGQKKNSGGQKNNSGGQKNNSGGQKNNAGGQKNNARGQKNNARGQKNNARGQQNNARGQQNNAGGQKNNAGGRGNNGTDIKAQGSKVKQVPKDPIPIPDGVPKKKSARRRYKLKVRQQEEMKRQADLEASTVPAKKSKLEPDPESLIAANPAAKTTVAPELKSGTEAGQKTLAAQAVLGKPWKELSPSDYFDVPEHYMQCSVCNLEIVDFIDFHGHLNDDNHLKAIENDIKMGEEKAVIWKRHIAKIEFARTKSFKSLNAEPSKTRLCFICRVNFSGTLGMHCLKPYHLKLKSYIHPKCPPCDIEFKTRVEWENHRFSPEHFMALSKKNLPADYVLEADVKFFAAVEGLRKKLDEKDEDSPDEDDEADIFCGWTPLATAQELSKNPETMLGIKDEDKGDLQEHASDKVVGWEHIVPVQGYFCVLCKMVLCNMDTMTSHLKSLDHWRNCSKQSSEENKSQGKDTECKAVKLSKNSVATEEITIDDDDDVMQEDITIQDEEMEVVDKGDDEVNGEDKGTNGEDKGTNVEDKGTNVEEVVNDEDQVIDEEVVNDEDQVIDDEVVNDEDQVIDEEVVSDEDQVVNDEDVNNDVEEVDNDEDLIDDEDQGAKDDEDNVFIDEEEEGH